MLRKIALVLAAAALAQAASAQELKLNVIQETLALTKNDVVEAEPGFMNGQPVVRIRLAPAAAARFGEITGRNVRKVMQVAVGDRILTSPVIMGPITGGEIMIQGTFTIEEADAIAKRFK